MAEPRTIVYVGAPFYVRGWFKTERVRNIKIDIPGEPIEYQMRCEDTTPDRCYVIEGRVTAVV